MSKQAIEGAKRSNLFHVSPDDLVVIGLDTPDGPEHPLYDTRIKLPVEENMVRNVMALGILEPVLVRKDGDALQIIAGRQRVRAAREANKRLTAEGKEPLFVPVMSPRRGTDDAHLGVLISENELRREDSFRSKAEKALKLSQEYGKTPDDIALLFGVNSGTVKGWLSFFDLSAKVQKAVEEGRIAPAPATRLATLSREMQDAALEEMLASGEASTKHINAKVRQKKAPEANGEATAPVSKKLLTAVLESEAAKELPEGFVDGIKFCLGELRAQRVRGLTAIINTVNADREARGKAPLYTTSQEG